VGGFGNSEIPLLSSFLYLFGNAEGMYSTCIFSNKLGASGAG
jgi:hypothetical protein